MDALKSFIKTMILIKENGIRVHPMDSVENYRLMVMLVQFGMSMERRLINGGHRITKSIIKMFHSNLCGAYILYLFKSITIGLIDKNIPATCIQPPR